METSRRWRWAAAGLLLMGLFDINWNLANFFGRRILRHEERHLVSLKEIVEIHKCSHRRKRERGRSLSRVGLRQLISTR